MTQPWPALLYALALATSAPASSPAAAAPDHTCSWTFPGGSPPSSSSCVPPPVTFSAPGPKKVTLKVCTASCSSVTKTVLVADPRPAIVQVTTSPATAIYPGDSVSLAAQVTGREPLKLSWTLPGKIVSSSNPVTFNVPPSAARIFVPLTVSNAAGTASRSVALTVLDPRPRGTLRIAPAVPYLGDLLTASIEATGRPPYTYRWNLLPDGVSSSESTLVWDSSSASPGWRRLELVLSNGSGTTKLTRSFRLDPPPLGVSFAPECPNLCFFNPGQSIAFALAIHPKVPAPSRYEYDWNGDGVFEDSSPTPLTTHSYALSGSFRPRVRLTAPGKHTQTLLSTRILVISKSR